VKTELTFTTIPSELSIIQDRRQKNHRHVQTHMWNLCSDLVAWCIQMHWSLLSFMFDGFSRVS